MLRIVVPLECLVSYFWIIIIIIIVIINLFIYFSFLWLFCQFLLKHIAKMECLFTYSGQILFRLETEYVDVRLVGSCFVYTEAWL